MCENMEDKVPERAKDNSIIWVKIRIYLIEK